MVLNRLKRGPARRDERGAVAVVVAISFTVFVILVALVVDLGLARDTRRVSQNAADASALAAANTLYPERRPAPPAAPSRVWPTPSPRSRATPRPTSPSLPPSGRPARPRCRAATSPWVARRASPSTARRAPTKVWVRIPTRNVKTNFAGIIGKSNVAVGSQAEAEIGHRRQVQPVLPRHRRRRERRLQRHRRRDRRQRQRRRGSEQLLELERRTASSAPSTGASSRPAPTPISPFGDPLAVARPPAQRPDPHREDQPVHPGPGDLQHRHQPGQQRRLHTSPPGLYVINRDVGHREQHRRHLPDVHRDLA